MNRNELEARYHDAIDITFNSLQQLFLLTQRMAQQLDNSDGQVATRQQLLDIIGQIESIGTSIRNELQSFSATMEIFLANSDEEIRDTE